MFVLCAIVTGVAQSDSCVITSLPQFWDFETNNIGGTTDKPLPACWNRLISGSHISVPYVYENAGLSHSGSKFLELFNTRGWYVTLPPLSDTISVNQVGLSFYLKLYLSPIHDSLEVGVMTDPNDVSTFTAIDTFSSIPAGYQFMTVDFSGYNGNGKIIAFHDNTTNGYGSAMFIDDVTLTWLPLPNLPSCYSPTALSVANVDAHSVDVTWTHDADSTVYVIHYKPTTDTIWLTDTVSVTSCTINGLIPLTTYELFVIALCNPDSPSGTVTFTTDCAADITSVPQTWDFEETNYQMPACWTKISTGTFPCVDVNLATSNGNALVFFQSAGGFAIMPYVNPNYLDIHNLQISFNVYNYRAFMYAGASIDVGVMTDPTDPASFTLVRRLDNLTEEYGYVTIPFYLYEGSGTYIAFRDSNSVQSSNSNLYDILIDDLTIDFCDSIPCAIPQQLVVSDITDSSAVLAWQNEVDWFVGDVTYLVYYKPSSEAVWQTDTVVPGQYTYTLTGLDTVTVYDCYVVAACNPDSPSGIVQFTTLAPEPGSDSTGIRPYAHNTAFDLVLYPNPVREYVDVRATDENVRISGIEVYDIYGKVVRTVVGANNDSPTYRINLSGLASGVYIAHIQTESGIIDLKFVKQR